MAIQLTGTGGLFTRLGKIGRIAQAIAVGESALLAPFANLMAQYDSSLQSAIAPVALTEDQSIRANSNVMAFAQQLAQTTIIGMASADVPVIQTLSDALTELRRQMVVYGQTVAQCNLSINTQVIPGSVGNGVTVFSTKRGDGLSQQNMIAEQARLMCTADSYTGGATQGRESFVFLGDPQNAGVWDYDWPQGSQAFSSLTAISASQYGSSSGNVLVNGDWENWVSNAASNWTLSVGTWGTDAIQSSTVYQGSFSLELAPTGRATSLLQTFANASTGSGVSLTPQQSYAVNFWLHSGPGTVTAGVLFVELVDGNGVVTQDQQGMNNSFSVDLTTVPGSWTPYSGVFRLASPPPATGVQLRLRLGTGLLGTYILLDSLAMAPLTAAYTGGPGVAIFSGSTPFVLSDGWTVFSANDRAGQAYLGTFQALFNKLFGTMQGNYILPYSSSPTIADTLISAGGTSGSAVGKLGLTYP